MIPFILFVYYILLGGYNFQNTARYWAYLTSIICKSKEPLDNDIPDNKYFLRYGPGYELSISRKNIDDSNTEIEMESTYEAVRGNFNWMYIMRLQILC